MLVPLVLDEDDVRLSLLPPLALTRASVSSKPPLALVAELLRDVVVLLPDDVVLLLPALLLLEPPWRMHPVTMKLAP